MEPSGGLKSGGKEYITIQAAKNSEGGKTTLRAQGVAKNPQGGKPWVKS